MPIRALSLPVVGAPYANKDGSNRKFEILLCSPGEPLVLQHAPKNIHDEHAIEVFSTRGVQIGYISSERAPVLTTLLRGGHVLHAIFQAETEWGAIARIGVDGPPDLPAPGASRAAKTRPLPEGADPESRFYPDEIPPDE